MICKCDLLQNALYSRSVPCDLCAKALICVSDKCTDPNHSRINTIRYRQAKWLYSFGIDTSFTTFRKRWQVFKSRMTPASLTGRYFFDEHQERNIIQVLGDYRTDRLALRISSKDNVQLFLRCEEVRLKCLVEVTMFPIFPIIRSRAQIGLDPRSRSLLVSG